MIPSANRGCALRQQALITDQYDGLVPKWLRFLRGVIDTPDVDLNVSREMLQQSPAVTRISKAVIKRVLGELKRRWKSAARNMSRCGSRLAG